MTIQTEISSLNQIDYLPYIDETGSILEDLQGKIGVYAIFNQDKELQFVGYSRDIYISLKQHLVRQPENCYWLKIQTISRPSRTFLEEIQSYWIEENGKTPSGNDSEQTKWSEPIDAKLLMSEAEKEEYQKLQDELGQIKLLKKICRRVEEDLLSQLKSRGIQMEIRFNPKLKEQGLLDIK